MDILYYGGHYWNDGAWFRKQQFASRLSKRGHRVFYVEDAPSMIRKNKDHKNKYFKTILEKINNNLFIISPSAVFPFPRSNFFRKIYNIKLLNDVNKIFRNYNINNYLLWVNRVEFSTVFNKISSTKIIDICDDIPFYQKLTGDEKGYKSAVKFFNLAFKNADIPIVSAQKIKEKYKYLTDKEMIVVPNGHNIMQRKISLGIPEELRKIPRPIIGFLGTLFQFTDDKLLEFLIKHRPNYSFVFVGHIEGSFPIEKINKYKNVYLLGKKPKEVIPSFVNAFDVCINPFKVHEVNDSVSPVKVFEYLALNKVVISTVMYSLMKEKISSYIEFAKDYEEFLFKIDEHVKTNNYINKIPHEVLDKYSWDGLFERMTTQIKEKYKIEL